MHNFEAIATIVLYRSGLATDAIALSQDGCNYRISHHTNSTTAKPTRKPLNKIV
ncbi:MAG: hypothetical protein LH647_03655 [Leptolyngbyaceae cyanobacterium CAN_BIN12]|nr:hypothetical protein [Leptolyngbyaceae cyanobacterium CAN_BIN12]